MRTPVLVVTVVAVLGATVAGTVLWSQRNSDPVELPSAEVRQYRVIVIQPYRKLGPLECFFYCTQHLDLLLARLDLLCHTSSLENRPMYVVYYRFLLLERLRFLRPRPFPLPTPMSRW